MRKYVAGLLALCLCLLTSSAMAARDIIFIAPTASELVLPEGAQQVDTEDGQSYTFPVDEVWQFFVYYDQGGALTEYVFVLTVMGTSPYLRFDAEGTLIENQAQELFMPSSCPRVIVGKRPEVVMPTADVETAPLTIGDIAGLPHIPVPTLQLEQGDKAWTISNVSFDGIYVSFAEVRYTTRGGESITCDMRYDEATDTLIWDNRQEIAAYRELQDKDELDAEKSQVFIEYETLYGWYSEEARLHTQYFWSTGSASTGYSDGPYVVFRDNESDVGWRVDMRDDNNQTLWMALYDADGQQITAFIPPDR